MKKKFIMEVENYLDTYNDKMNELFFLIEFGKYIDSLEYFPTDRDIEKILSSNELLLNLIKKYSCDREIIEMINESSKTLVLFFEYYCNENGINIYGIIDNYEFDNESDKIDGINEYVKQMRKVDLLTRDEEIELAKRIEKNDKEARRKLIEANLRLVYSIAKKYINSALDFEDIIQYGNEGLIKAADEYDYRYETKFSTFATWQIRKYISHALRVDSRIIRVPEWKFEKISKYIVKINALAQKLVHTPSKEEIKEQLDLSEEEIDEILMLGSNVLSIDKEYNEDDDESTLLDIHASDKNVENEVVENISNILIVEILNNMKCLSNRDLRILYLKSGLEDGYVHNNQSIANMFGVSRQSVSERIKRIYERINTTKEGSILKTFLDDHNSENIPLIIKDVEVIPRDEMYEEIWNERYIKYIEYINEYGIEPMPTVKYKEYYIGKWALEQRMIKKHGTVMNNGDIIYEDKTLTKEHIEMLNLIGFNWNYMIANDNNVRKRLKNTRENVNIQNA